ncbi:MAG TPA: GTPase HflX [Thermoanaerobaculia bacterium]|jgi:GTP-binding protein HflX
MPEKAIAVALILPQVSRDVAEEHLEELAQLIATAGGEIVGKVFGKRSAPDSATYIGKGKAEELGRLASQQGAKLIIFDDDLSPAQVRNVQKIVGEGAKVIDRSALILDIFAGRAKTREARTQVELAQLEYMLPRLTRAWTHLERQAGGIGTRGVGETQLELDRRIVRTRIARLKEELQRIEKTRETQRHKRRQEAFTVALVGYTNAGKSTLFNRLTVGGAEAMDRLFATLDARSQKTIFEMPRETVIIDTVGFIRKLPHHLVASFRSTMEEAVAADVVLHVIDASHPQYTEQREIGDEVLADLGVDAIRVLEVYNKADRLDEHFEIHRRNTATVSALTGQGIETLVEMIRDRERSGGALMHLVIPHEESKLVAKLHEVAEIQEQSATDDAACFTAWVPGDVVHLFTPYVRRSQAKRAV